jgi:hypothetical protein
VPVYLPQRSVRAALASERAAMRPPHHTSAPPRARRGAGLAATAALLGALGALAACGGEEPPPDPCATPPRFTELSGSVLQVSCLGCHSQRVSGLARRGAPVGVDFDTFALAEPSKAALADAITSGRMPPTSASNVVPTTAEGRQLAAGWRTCGYAP